MRSRSTSDRWRYWKKPSVPITLTVAVLLNNLAVLYQAQGRYADAGAALQAVVGD